MSSKITNLDHEPKASTKSYPPSSRPEDTWSTVTDMGPRRNSWTNLVDIGNQINTAKLPPPRPAPVARPDVFGSRASSEFNLAPATTFKHTFVASTTDTLHHHEKTVKYIDERDSPHSSKNSSSTRSTLTSPAVIASATIPQLPAKGNPQAQVVYATDPRNVQIAARPAGTVPQSVASSRAPSVVQIPSAPLVKKAPIQYQQNSRRSSPRSSETTEKRNRLQDILGFLKRMRRPFCYILFLLIAVAIILAIVLPIALNRKQKYSMEWTAPASLTNGQNSTATVQMDVVSKDRIRFEFKGSEPISGQFVTYYDFKNNQEIIVDTALATNGKNLYCFLLPLDRSLIGGLSAATGAAANSKNVQQTSGWTEQWSWITNALSSSTSTSSNMFNPPIPECNGSRIVQLQQSGDQSNRRCIDCQPVCLPDYGIVKNGTREVLNVARQDCFWLYVPEGRSNVQQTSQQHQQDYEEYYRNRNHLRIDMNNPDGGLGTYSNQNQQQNYGSQMTIAGVPTSTNQVINATHALMGSIGQTAGQLTQNTANRVGLNTNQANSYVPTGTGQSQNGQLQNYGYSNGQQQQQNQQNQQSYGGYNSNSNANTNVNANAYSNGFSNTNAGYTNNIGGRIFRQYRQQMSGQNQGQQQQQQNQQPSGVVSSSRHQVSSSSSSRNSAGRQQNQFGTLSGVNQNNNNQFNYNNGVHSGSTNGQQSTNHGNSQQQQLQQQQQQQTMNGFGAVPSYETSKYGFTSIVQNTPPPQQGYGQPAVNMGVTGSQTQLNEYGNPIQTSNLQAQGISVIPNRLMPPNPALQTQTYTNPSSSTGYGASSFVHNYPQAQNFENLQQTQLSNQQKTMTADSNGYSTGGNIPIYYRSQQGFRR